MIFNIFIGFLINIQFLIQYQCLKKTYSSDKFCFLFCRLFSIYENKTHIIYDCLFNFPPIIEFIFHIGQIFFVKRINIRDIRGKKMNDWEKTGRKYIETGNDGERYIIGYLQTKKRINEKISNIIYGEKE